MSGSSPPDDDRLAATAGAHEAVRDLLLGYVTATARGQEAQRLYPDLAAHIQRCAFCQGEVAELVALLVPAYQDEVPPAAASPVPDTSFLRLVTSVPESGAPWSFDRVGRLVIQFSQVLLDATRPATTLAGALRGQLLHSLDLPAGEETEVALRVEIFAISEEQATVTVAVDDPQRDPLDQSGVPITLRIGAQHWERKSDESGHATFEGVPRAQLAELRVTVQQEF